MAQISQGASAIGGQQQETGHGRQAIAARDEKQHHRQHIDSRKEQDEISCRGAAFRFEQDIGHPEKGEGRDQAKGEREAVLPQQKAQQRRVLRGEVRVGIAGDLGSVPKQIALVQEQGQIVRLDRCVYTSQDLPKR